MKILAIETATEACSAALFQDGEVIERFTVAPRLHTDLILPMVEDLLSAAQLELNNLDALAFGRGPGAFTGVRIAAGVTQGLALGGDLPVVPVSTLAALASEALDESQAEYALAVLDARMGEVYWGVYARGALLRCVGSESVSAPEAVVLNDEVNGNLVGIGPGWKAYGEALKQRVGERLCDVRCDRLPRAGYIARLAVEAFVDGRNVPAEEALPVYLRNQVARPQAKEKKRASP